LIQAHKRAPVKLQSSDATVDYGFVGDIDYIDTDVIRKLLDNGLMPVISPLSSDGSGTLLNINADTVAAAIGSALGAEKLVLCTGAPGILENVDDPSSVISITDLAGLDRLKKEKRVIDGMLPKVKAIETALHGGVRRVHVISYKAPDAILAEVFTNEGTGTLVVSNMKGLAAAELAAGGATMS
jgi:acetylglutamate kinase